MRKGTFSVRKATSNSSDHNSRWKSPKYLIGLSSNTSNYYRSIIDDEIFIEYAKNKYKSKNKQTMQKKNVENLILETVITLKKNQDEKDIDDLFNKLSQKYGGHLLLEIAIHRDEGHFLKNGIGYYPTKNIIKKKNDWYVCSDLTVTNPKENDFNMIVDIEEYTKIYNYHAHAKFSMFDINLGKTARMQRKDMSSRIKFVSEELGLDYNPGKDRRVKKSVNQIKNEHFAVSNTKEVDFFIINKLEQNILALNNKNTELKCDRNRHKISIDILYEEIRKINIINSELKKEINSLKEVRLNKINKSQNFEGKSIEEKIDISKRKEEEKEISNFLKITIGDDYDEIIGFSP